MPWDLKFLAPYVAKRLGTPGVSCVTCGRVASAGEVYFFLEDTGSAFCSECFGPHLLVGDVHFKDGDLAIVEEPALDVQDALARLFTDSPDWYYYPDLGANLLDLKGKDNTRDTAARGIAMILSALTTDGRFPAGKIEVHAVPVSTSTLVFFLAVGGDTVVVPVEV